MRFVVHRLPQRAASPRRHGPSDRGVTDVAGGVHVSMRSVPTRCAPEDRLALSRLPVHLPAGMALLRRESRVHPDDSAGCLVLETLREEPPARCQDSTVQGGFGLDVLTRLLLGASGRTNHVRCLQVLDAEDVEGAARSVVFCSIQSLRRSTRRASGRAMRALIRSRRRDPRQAFTSRRCNRSYLSASFGRSPGAVSRCPVESAAETTTPRSMPTASLLLHHLRTRGQPRVLGPGLGQLTGLGHIVRRWLPAGAPTSLLLHSHIPDEPCVRAMRLEDRFLGGTRLETKLGHGRRTFSEHLMKGNPAVNVLRTSDLGGAVSGPRFLAAFETPTGGVR